MPFVFFHQLCNIILILHVLARLVKSELFKGLDLGVTQGNSLGSEELAEDVITDLAGTIGVHNAEGREQVLRGRRLKLICHEDVDHESLDLLLFNELRRLIVFELDDNIVTNLGLRRELKQVSHQVRDLTFVQETTTINIDDAEGLTDLLAIEIFLPLFLNWVLWVGQHFFQIV